MQKWKNNRRILLGISGGISAYKAPDLVRLFIKAGCDVEVIMTESAESFITPLTLSTLIGRPVWRERDFLSAESGWKIPHISLANWIIFWNTAMIVENAANDMNRKNRAPQILPPAISRNTFGSVTNTSPGP